MKSATERQGQSPEENEFDNALEEVLREGARKMLQSAIENEVSEYIGNIHPLKMNVGNTRQCGMVICRKDRY
ncbi:MAG: hypothetical protein J7J10_03295 [Deltaproteobacteria bacterium]|nr:hypothetical protein [Deltaproteobacteria bacterium]